MRNQNKIIILILIVLSIAALAVFSVPNSKASENLAMVTMFEPDESAMIPIVKRMVSPQPNWVHRIYRIIAYGFYHYGFPLFAPTALVYKILTLFGQGDNMPLVMLYMRQVISVFPMLLSLWVLVYLQDQFKSWRSIALFIFLLSIPAVIQNGFWWHPDGLVMLLSSLVLLALWKDDLRFGKYYYFAAALCGVLTALKVVGLFFFLTVAMILIWGLAEKKLTWKQFFRHAFLFIAVMAIAILVSSPHLLIPNHRVLAFNTLKREIFETSKGYGIYYAKGLQAAIPTLKEFYGNPVFIIFALAVSVGSLFDKETRFLRALILTWFIPLTVHLLFFSHFKYQYWLPVAVPLFSNLAILLPSKIRAVQKPATFVSAIKWAALLVVVLQFGLFIPKDIALFTSSIHRKEENPAIRFYDQAVEELSPVTQDVKVYYDYRLYMPATPGWSAETSFDLLTYDYISSHDFDVLLLSQQRILDYIQPEAVGIDPETYALAKVFYQDANLGKIENYKMLLRNDTALIFIKEEICLEYYESARCH